MTAIPKYYHSMGECYRIVKVADNVAEANAYCEAHAADDVGVAAEAGGKIIIAENKPCSAFKKVAS